MAFRRFIDLYRPADIMRLPEQDGVMVCRCEEVSLGDIRRAVSEGCIGPNQPKALLVVAWALPGAPVRAGGIGVDSQAQGQTIEQGGYYRLFFYAKATK